MISLSFLFSHIVSSSENGKKQPCYWESLNTSNTAYFLLFYLSKISGPDK